MILSVGFKIGDLIMVFPVFISVYDRPKHFSKCINSLLRNVGASETTVYISSDGPKCEKSEIYVNEVRKVISSITGFKELNVQAPKDNTNGVIAHEFLTEIKRKFGAVIATEDDNIFGRYALKYYNDGLKYFWNDDSVHYVCGYTYPGLKFKEQRYILVRSFSAWGIGLWDHKDIRQFSDHKKIAQEILSDWDYYSKVNSTFPNIPPMLIPMAEGRIKANDIVRSAKLVACDAKSIFPTNSVVENIGRDGSGKHKVKDFKTLKNPPSDLKVSFGNDKNTYYSDIFTRHFFNYLGGACRCRVNIYLFKYINGPKGITNNLDRLIVRLLGKLCAMKDNFLYIAEFCAVMYKFIS